MEVKVKPELSDGDEDTSSDEGTTTARDIKKKDPDDDAPFYGGMTWFTSL